MLKLAFLLLVATFASTSGVSAAGLAINSHLSAGDLQRLQLVFADGLQSGDLQTLYYSVLNYKAITAAQQKDACQRIVQLHRDSKLNDFEKNFYLLASFKQLLCVAPIDEAIQNAVATRKEFSSAQDVYFTYGGIRAMATKLRDDEKQAWAKKLVAIVKKDDSLASLGYAFHVAAELGAAAAPIADWVEGAVAQADEIDGKQLQFEGGLSITALVLNGAFKLTTALGKPAPLTAAQTLKFTTYLLSRRSVQLAKGASCLLEVLATISRQPALAPICIATIGNGQVTAGSGAVLSVRIVDVLGAAIRPPIAAVSAVVKTVGATASAAPAIAKTALTVRSSDATVYTLDLSTLARGSYSVQVAADALAASLPIRVLGRVRVAQLEVGVGEADSTSAIRKQAVPFQQMLAAELQADAQQKLQLRAQLVDEQSGAALSVHQAFVRLEHKETGEEIIYVAELDAQRAYKFDLDVGARSADFGHRSGVYALEFIVGDASLSNSFRWLVADVQLRFAGAASSEQQRQTAAQTVHRQLRPEIEHLFRVPEPRPARLVSDLFTGLCAAPLLVLFALWAKLGVNVRNFPFSVSAIGFHAGFGSILALFGVFFWRLNMFETIRYLVPLALVTFFFGNRLLRKIAAGGKA